MQECALPGLATAMPQVQQSVLSWSDPERSAEHSLLQVCAEGPPRALLQPVLMPACASPRPGCTVHQQPMISAAESHCYQVRWRVLHLAGKRAQLCTCVAGVVTCCQMAYAAHCLSCFSLFQWMKMKQVIACGHYKSGTAVRHLMLCAILDEVISRCGQGSEKVRLTPLTINDTET